VAGKFKGAAFGIFIIYIVSLSIFPGFIAEDLESKLLRDWYPILLITVYNSSARLLFYPLFAVSSWTKVAES